MINQRIMYNLMLTTTRNKLALISMMGHILRPIRTVVGLKDQLIKIERNGLLWNLDLKEGIDLCLFIYGNYELEVEKMYQKIIKEDSVILDIGANIGAHSLPMASLLNHTGKVYSFEPTSFAAKKLALNIENNPTLKSKISIEKVYLTSTQNPQMPETLSSSWDIERPLEDRMRNKLDKGFAQSTLGAKAMTLDAWMAEKNLNRLDLIKLDVDGAEVDVMKGAIKTINKYRPKILIELSPIHFEKSHTSFKDQINILKSLNYQLQDVFGNDIPLDAAYLEKWIPYGTLVNALAIPL